MIKRRLDKIKSETNNIQKSFLIVGVVTLLYVFGEVTTLFPDDIPKYFILVGCGLGYYLFKD